MINAPDVEAIFHAMTQLDAHRRALLAALRTPLVPQPAPQPLTNPPSAA